MGVIKVLEDGLHFGVRRGRTGGIEGVVPEGERTSLRVGGEIVPQPNLLERIGPAAADERTVAVDDNNVPSPEVQAVVAFRRIACSRTKIVEVPDGESRIVFMVARDGDGSSPCPSPRRVVRLCKVAVCPVVVDDVTGGEHRGTGVGIEQRRRCHRVSEGQVESVGDVTRPDQSDIGGLRGRLPAWPAENAGDCQQQSS